MFIKKANLEFFDYEQEIVKAECTDFFKNKMLDQLIQSYDPERQKGNRIKRDESNSNGAYEIAKND